MRSNSNEPYYKLYKDSRLKDKLTIVCLQWFDESGYDEDRFLKDKYGCNTLKFDTLKEAKEWLNENIKDELIDPEYLAIRKDSDYYK